MSSAHGEPRLSFRQWLYYRWYLYTLIRDRRDEGKPVDEEWKQQAKKEARDVTRRVR